MPGSNLGKRFIAPYCWLGVTKRPAWTKRRLVALPFVLRVTDHGTHLKVHSTRFLPRIKGFRTIGVRDQTRDVDAMYWVFAMQAVRHAQRKRQRPEQWIAILTHYLCNLTGIPEREFLWLLAAERGYLDRVMTDDQAHGWELRALRKAKML